MKTVNVEFENKAGGFYIFKDCETYQPINDVSKFEDSVLTEDIGEDYELLLLNTGSELLYTTFHKTSMNWINKNCVVYDTEV